jgi:hypothetical protein
MILIQSAAIRETCLPDGQVCGKIFEPSTVLDNVH